MQFKKDGKINWFLFLRFFGISLFVIVLFKIDLTQVWTCITKIEGKYFFIALLFQFILLISKGIRWHLLKQSHERSGFLQNTAVFFESYAIGVATPGRVGEFTKIGYENGKQGKVASLLRIVSERGFDLGIFILIAGSALLFYPNLEIGSFIAVLIVTLAVVLILISFLLLSNNTFATFLNTLISKFIFRKKPISLVTLSHSVPSSIFIFALSLVGSLCHFISCYFLAYGLSFSYGFIEVSGVVSIAGLLNLLPITIMGLGTREVIFLYFFNNIDSSIILAFSFLVFFVAQIGGGLIALLLSQLLMVIDKKQKK